jgi:hypothetical protein
LAKGQAAAQFVLLDWLSPVQQRLASLSDLAMVLQTWGHQVTILGGQDAVSYVAGLAQALDERQAGGQRTRLFIVGWGVHRASGLDTPEPISLDRPVDGMHRVIKDGPVLGVHLIGWWNSYKAYEQHVEGNFSISGVAQGFVFLRASQPDVSNVMGPFVEWQPQPNRALYFDRSGSERGVIIVPFAHVDQHALQRLARVT